MKKSVVKNEKGQASLEVVPLLAIFLLFAGYGMGAFGIVHTGILHNIAARTYAFETFRHRANLVYFRENRIVPQPEHYQEYGIRLHAVKHETAQGQYVFATERQISFGFENEIAGRSPNVHDRLGEQIQPGRRAPTNTSVNPRGLRFSTGFV